VELSDYLRVFRRHWLGVFLIAGGAVLAAAGISLQQDKVYAADASGFVTAGSSNNPAEASVGDTLAKSRATSYVDLAKSRAVARNAAVNMKLDIDPSALIERIAVEQPLDTVLIKVTARDSTPVAAQKLADAWVMSLADQVASIENPDGEGKTLRLVPIESAELPSSPISPNIPRNLALGLVIGLVLGAGYALVRSQIDRRISDAETVEREFGVMVASAIPAESVLARTDDGRAMMAAEGHINSPGQSRAREAFLKLRTNLQFIDVDNPPRVLVVTSPLPGDGKSTVAANLAAAMSQTGVAVALVDGDLRKPMVAGTFGLPGSVGLTDLIIGTSEIDDVIQHVSSLPNLAIIAAGRVPPNPSELLGTKSMQRLLTKLSEEYIVVIDAPPLLPVTDAAVLTAGADGALVVITARKTLDTQLRDALQLVTRVQGRTLGVVFNQVTKSDAASGFYGSYYGGYGAQKLPAPPASKRRRAKPKPRRATAVNDRSRRR
jgi:capsular exopolysaccharide synthesis family protein